MTDALPVAWNPLEVAPLETALTSERVEGACFAPLFERGRALAEAGKVVGLALFATEARGHVQGGESAPYEVAIGAQLGPENAPRIGWSTCTCKFAQSNAAGSSLCKHMAAFALVAGVAYRVEREAAEIAAATAPALTLRTSAPRL